MQDSFSIAAGSTIGAALRAAPLPALESRILLGKALQLSRIQLITQSERVLNDDETRSATELIRRRLAGEPIAYIVGEREFYGLAFHVTPDVLIPRPETELLVELALNRMPERSSVLDLGTGSGAIAVAIAHARADAKVTAVDANTAALVIAERNARRHGANVRFLQSDWYGALGNEHFNLIVSNPPYIANGDLHLSQGDLRFEPVDALTDHNDGLSALRIIINGANERLAPGGWLLMEHGYDQSAAVRALLASSEFAEVQSWADLAGIERVTGGRKT
ncbi:MAG TPA: peptide chain release factor N(5)-glutamine methyltransferase [Noviherbaspirillum sp.]